MLCSMKNEFPYSGGFPRIEKLSPLAQTSFPFQFLDNLEDGPSLEPKEKSI